MAAKNKEDISINTDQIAIHKKEIEEGKKERREMAETIEVLKRDMADQKRGRSRTIIVIQGEGVPARVPEEDIFKIAKELIMTLTKEEIQEGEVKNCHRSGPNGGIILVDFLCLGEGSRLWNILGARDFQTSKSSQVWINLHQTQFDRGLFFLARKLVQAGQLEKAFVNNNATTVVVKQKQKHIIMNENDLKKLTSFDLDSLKTAKK